MDPSHAALRKLGKTAAAMREQPIKCVDGEAHDFSLALPPALIAPQHSQSTRIFARSARGEHQLRKSRSIKNSEVDALTGKRMQHVRGIPHERAALGHVVRCAQLLQWK